MRTIKFRVWSQEKKSMLYFDLWAASQVVRDLLLTYKISKEEMDKMMDTVGQFTGLFDCKGKEIYEGDIVKYTNCTGDKEIRVVEYMSDYDAGFFPFTSCSCGDVKATDPEIIGNIYENPELR